MKTIYLLCIFGKTDTDLLVLLAEKQNIYASFPFIQCQLGGGWWAISTRPKSRYFGNSSQENIKTTTCINVPRAYICALETVSLKVFPSFKSERQHPRIPDPLSQNLPNEGVPKHLHHNIRQFLSKQSDL